MIGIDLQQVDRIENPEKLLNKIASKTEIAYIQKHKQDFKMRVASLWAVKEAVFKALDMPKEDFAFLDIEVSHQPNGRPTISLSGKAQKRLTELGKQIDVSISHQPQYVVAVVQIC